jgi:hypothetical protein
MPIEWTPSGGIVGTLDFTKFENDYVVVHFGGAIASADLTLAAVIWWKFKFQKTRESIQLFMGDMAIRTSSEKNILTASFNAGVRQLSRRTAPTLNPIRPGICPMSATEGTVDMRMRAIKTSTAAQARRPPGRGLFCCPQIGTPCHAESARKGAFRINETCSGIITVEMAVTFTLTFVPCYETR